MASCSKGKGSVKTVEWSDHPRDRNQNKRVRKDGKKRIREEV